MVIIFSYCKASEYKDHIYSGSSYILHTVLKVVVDLGQVIIHYAEAKFDHEPTDDDKEEMRKSIITRLRNRLLTDAACYAKLNEMSGTYPDGLNYLVINGTPTWYGSELRGKILDRIGADKANNVATYDLIIRSTARPDESRLSTISVGTVCDIMNKVELYAQRVFVRQVKHRAEIMKLNTIEELVNYNFKTGYPEPLIFEIDELNTIEGFAADSASFDNGL